MKQEQQTVLIQLQTSKFRSTQSRNTVKMTIKVELRKIRAR